VRDTALGSIQRFICREYGFRFSEKSYKDYSTIENRQLCALLEAKKLDAQTEIKTVAGENSQTVKCTLTQFSLYMQKEGMANSTINGV
jgi:hypothetical protein